MNNTHKSYKVAIGGIVSALALALMFMTGVFPLLSFAIPIYAGALMIVVATEINSAWAWAAYLAVSLLSLFLTPDKQSSTIFIFFFGYYPILIPYLRRIKPAVLRFLVKYAFFMVAMFIWYKMITYLFGIYDFFSNFSFLGKYFTLGVVAFISMIFFLYDYTIEAIEEVYVQWFRPVYFGKK
ncbi:MAG: hypothetical protein K6G68_04890 [Oscillospiraceae bacterium]|nr:hypothetical protein [Oscillospiraceae bacterium]